VEPDATAGLVYPGADFEEFESDGSCLGGAQFGSLQVSAQKPEQAVSRGMEQEPELVGLEAMATEPVGFQIELQFLDPVFRFTPHHVNVIIDGLGVGSTLWEAIPPLPPLGGSASRSRLYI